MTFRHYLTAFDGRGLPVDALRHLGATTIPAFMRALSELNLEPLIGHDLDRIASIQRASEGRMRLIPLSDPARNPDADASNTIVLVLTRSGADVACAGIRIIWLENSLAEAMVAMFSAEEVTVSAPRAYEIKACFVAFSVSFYVSRGESPMVATVMSRLLHLFAVAQFNWSHLVAIAERAQARLLAHDIHGFTSTELGVWRDGREYMLLHAPRQNFRALALSPRFGNLSASLGAAPG